jgi:predicted porin
VWSGFIHQDVELPDLDFKYRYQGFDVGTHLALGGLGLTLNYTDTTGIGADGLYGFGGIDDAEVDATQWYVELDYTFGKTMLGVSYGEGKQDATVTRVGSAEAGRNQMGMLFARYQLTPQLTLMGELQAFRSDLQKEYDLVALGVQFDF